APGSVPTPATEGFVTPEQYEQRAKNIPLRRNGTPEDVAHAVAFLLSDAAAFINGAMLALDGGIIAAGRARDPSPPATHRDRTPAPRRGGGRGRGSAAKPRVDAGAVHPHPTLPFKGEEELPPPRSANESALSL